MFKKSLIIYVNKSCDCFSTYFNVVQKNALSLRWIGAENFRNESNICFAAHTFPPTHSLCFTKNGDIYLVRMHPGNTTSCSILTNANSIQRINEKREKQNEKKTKLTTTLNEKSPFTSVPKCQDLVYKIHTIF